MSMFTNGVGRPSNETIKKRNIFKILCILLIIVVVSMVLYTVNYSSKHLSQNEAKNILHEIVEEDEYETKFPYLIPNSDDRNYNNLSKEYLNSDEAITSISLAQAYGDYLKEDCNNIFDSIQLEKESTSDNKYKYISSNTNAVTPVCNNELEMRLYDYNYLNETARRLFGNNKNIIKEDIIDGTTTYAYSKKKNGFIELECDECNIFIADPWVLVKNGYKDKDNVYINIVYAKILASSPDKKTDKYLKFELLLKDGSTKKISPHETNDYLIKGNYRLLEKNQDKLPNLQIKLFKEDGIYKIDSIKKIN